MGLEQAYLHAMTIEELLSSAQEKLDAWDYEAAKDLAHQALVLHPASGKALEFMGILHAEFGEPGEAVRYLKEAVLHEPHQAPTKYLYLGQLSAGAGAVQYYRKGIEVMQKDLLSAAAAAAAAADKEHEDETKDSIVSALVSIAELYMTDLCEEESAEVLCESALDEAIQYQRGTAEVYQALANLRLSQERREESLAALHRSISTWLPRKRALAGLSEFPPEEDLSWLPPLEFRAQTCRHLIELEQYESAGELLEDLLTEDEEHVELWYLLGLSAYLQNEYPSARDALANGAKCYAKNGWEAPELMESVQRLMENVDYAEKRTLERS